MKKYYDLLDHMLRELLRTLVLELAAAETTEVEEYVDVGEYGIALETLCSILTEHGGECDVRVRDAIADLANTMNLQSKAIDGLLGR